MLNQPLLSFVYVVNVHVCFQCKNNEGGNIEEEEKKTEHWG